MGTSEHPFERLDLDFIMDAVEAQGYRCDGRNLALNSYENRVYQVGIDEQPPLIAKFYRPERWSDAQILEEHQLCFEMADADLPVVPPLKNADGESLFHYKGFRLALFERKGGRAPELSDLDCLFTLGRFLGRMHMVSKACNFTHRPAITAESFGHESVAFIRDNMIPDELKEAYVTLTTDIMTLVDQTMSDVGDICTIRVHGDCHIGNVLWRDDAPHFVDFDDARMAPAVQDIWMLLSGDRQQQLLQLAEIVEGYSEFSDFDARELRLIESLRTLRIINYAAWLARRWNDPAFPHNFPWFNTVRYWSEHILELREQFAALQEPPLVLMP